MSFVKLHHKLLNWGWVDDPNMVALLKLMTRLKKSVALFRMKDEQFKTIAKPTDEKGNNI